MKICENNQNIINPTKSTKNDKESKSQNKYNICSKIIKDFNFENQKWQNMENPGKLNKSDMIRTNKIRRNYIDLLNLRNKNTKYINNNFSYRISYLGKNHHMLNDGKNLKIELNNVIPKCQIDNPRGFSFHQRKTRSFKKNIL